MKSTSDLKPVKARALTNSLEGPQRGLSSPDNTNRRGLDIPRPLSSVPIATNNTVNKITLPLYCNAITHLGLLLKSYFLWTDLVCGVVSRNVSLP